MRTIVCGGRNYSNRKHVYAVLDRWRRECDYSLIIIQGGATGADALARDWCASRKIEYANVPADWQTHGKAAGPIRNAKMISDYDPKCLIAFPGGRGTADMIMKAQDAGLFVRIAIPDADGTMPAHREDGSSAQTVVSSNPSPVKQEERE